MLEIQLVGLQVALNAAKAIHSLEDAKDRVACEDKEVLAEFKADTNRCIADNHKILADLGLRLVPGPNVAPLSDEERAAAVEGFRAGFLDTTDDESWRIVGPGLYSAHPGKA